MKTLKWLLAGIVVGVIGVAFRDMENREWLRPALPERAREPGVEEPVLGYDGMDQETVIDWLFTAQLDAESLDRINRYEEVNLGREPVLEVLEELLG